MARNQIRDTCRAIHEFMEASWQKLPISHRFTEPIPTAVTLSIHKHGVAGLAIKPANSVFHAVRVALTETVNPIWLTGCAGGGKTSSMKWMAAQFARLKIAKTSSWLPVYIDLGQVGHELAGSNLEDVLAAQLRKRKPIDYTPFQTHLDECIFLLDGLDLMTGPISARMILDQALNATLGRFIFAGRAETIVTDALSNWSDSARIHLGELNEKDRVEWFTQNATKAALDKYYLIMSSNPQAVQLLAVPLLFAMTASVCMDSPEITEIDSNQYPGRSGIFAGFVEYAIHLAQRHGRIPASTTDNIKELSIAMGQKCLAAARLGHFDRIPKGLLYKLPTQQNSGSSWTTAKLVFEQAGILEETPGSYKFIHQQFAEYLASTALAGFWLEGADQPTFTSLVATDLSFRDRDPIVAHTLAIVGEQPRGKIILENVFAFLGLFHKGDTCILFAESGSPAVLPLIGSVIHDKTATDIDRNFAIHVLSRIPQEEAVRILASYVERHGEYSRELIHASVNALGKCIPTLANKILNQIANNSANPSWLRVLACANGALIPEPEVERIVQDALSMADLDIAIRKEVLRLSLLSENPSTDTVREYMDLQRLQMAEIGEITDQAVERFNIQAIQLPNSSPFDSVVHSKQENGRLTIRRFERNRTQEDRKADRDIARDTQAIDRAVAATIDDRQTLSMLCEPQE